jgi:hypothetical protein
VVADDDRRVCEVGPLDGGQEIEARAVGERGRQVEVVAEAARQHLVVGAVAVHEQRRVPVEDVTR